MHMTTQLPILMGAYCEGAISIICWPNDGSLFDRVARPDESSGEMHEHIVRNIVHTEACSRLHASQYIDVISNKESVEFKECCLHS